MGGGERQKVQTRLHGCFVSCCVVSNIESWEVTAPQKEGVYSSDRMVSEPKVQSQQRNVQAEFICCFESQNTPLYRFFGHGRLVAHRTPVVVLPFVACGTDCMVCFLLFFVVCLRCCRLFPLPLLRVISLFIATHTPVASAGNQPRNLAQACLTWIYSQLLLR